MEHLELCIEKKNLSVHDLEFLLANLAGSGFEAFLEEDELLKAYFKLSDPEKGIDIILSSVSSKLKSTINFHFNLISERNWNAEWEKNFSPIFIDEQVYIKAPFHTGNNAEYLITIEPKMSFGTGHHETTRLMIRSMLKESFEGKEVLDMGCGTGVLGILAKKMGARFVLSVDNDEWAYRNCIENFILNEIGMPYKIYHGELERVSNRNFDIILANINRNTLIQHIPAYWSLLNVDGNLIISGVLKEDQSHLVELAGENGLGLIECLYENNWISLKFRR